jgi:hypothetical protein
LIKGQLEIDLKLLEKKAIIRIKLSGDQKIIMVATMEELFDKKEAYKA